MRDAAEVDLDCDIAHMHPKDGTATIESRTARAAGQRGGPAERMLFGLALLSLSQAGAAWASESTRVPPSIDTLMERDAPAADAAAALLHSETERTQAAPRARVRVVGGEHGVDPFARSPGQLARLGDAAFGLHSSSALTSAGATLPDFGLHDRSLEDLTPREFRPRPRSLLDGSGRPGAEDSLMDDSDTWQRLASEYRAHRRLRVITLWDAGWSSLSLQTGKHGDPYLQWTGHLFGRSEMSHGLLDHWLPTLSASESSAGHGGIAHALAPASSSRSALSAISRPSPTIP